MSFANVSTCVRPLFQWPLNQPLLQCTDWNNAYTYSNASQRHEQTQLKPSMLIFLKLPNGQLSDPGCQGSGGERPEESDRDLRKQQALVYKVFKNLH